MAIEIMFVCGALSAIGLAVFTAGLVADLLDAGGKAQTASVIGLVMFVGASFGLYWSYNVAADEFAEASASARSLDNISAEADVLLERLRQAREAGN